GITWFEFERDEIPYYLNFQMLTLVGVFVLTWFLLNRTSIGRQIYAMGGNPDASQRLGFDLFKLHLIVYGYMGFIAGVASLVQAQLAQSVAPTVLVGAGYGRAGSTSPGRDVPGELGTGLFWRRATTC
ncbi:MAG: hypothetical protein KY463_16540, partial [Actinobacteria bacterium]|nr:hypothetical protein [Actinomycetota bacterium]